MNEGRTTAIFGVVAAVALGLAYWSKPESITKTSDLIDTLVGKDVFPEFQDPEAATSLEIVKYDEELASLKPFEVARDKISKLWKLPSNEDYPADAASQVRDATTPLIGLKILSVESNSRADHELYGVVEPDEEKLAAGTKGVGMKVQLKGDSDQILANLIIGKEVEQAEGQRYVRKPTEDAVYKVELSTDAFKTNFRDWIEAELLGVRSFDLTKVAVRDYELNLSSMTLARNFDADVAFDQANSNWSLASYKTYEGGAAAPAELAANEELNTEFLNNLRTAVQDLSIVDVKRKPKGLAASLKADESLLKDTDSMAALAQQGFIPADMNGSTEIFSVGGETIVGTDEGVDYVLRFGQATASMATLGEDAEGGLSRYLLVTARLDESKFPLPEIEPLPETVEEMLAREKAAEAPPEMSLVAPVPDAPTDPSGDNQGEAPAADMPELDAPQEPVMEKSDEAPPEPKPESGAEEAKAEEPKTEEPKAEDPAAEEPGSGNDDTCGVPEPQEEETTQEETTQEDTQQETETPSDAPTATEETQPQETEEELKERLEAVREQIARENQRLLDDRKEKMDGANKKVQELNARFSEWFYVVSDEVYKKVKINRESLIKTTATSQSDTPSFLQGINGLEGLEGIVPPQQPQP